MHPAVSFAAVMFGAALFGVAGAFVAVPVAALMLALFGIYSKKYDLVPELAALQAAQHEGKHETAQGAAESVASTDDKPRPAAAGA